MNTPDTPHWTLKLRFGVFHTIWVHSGPFGCLTKLGAKQAELVQKIVPRSRVRVFRNERTLSTPLDPKLIFWCVSFNFGALESVWLTYETRCKMGRTSAKVRATKSRQNFSQRTHLIHPIGPKTDVLVRFVLFGCIRKPFGCLTKLSTKRDELVQKFVPRSCFGIFRNERTRSTSLDPKLPFWCVSYYLGAFGTVWLPYETRCKTGRTSAQVRATKSRRNFSQRTHPIHPIGP